MIANVTYTDRWEVAILNFKGKRSGRRAVDGYDVTYPSRQMDLVRSR